jgi:hypothetical protein
MVGVNVGTLAFPALTSAGNFKFQGLSKSGDTVCVTEQGFNAALTPVGAVIPASKEVFVWAANQIGSPIVTASVKVKVFEDIEPDTSIELEIAEEPFTVIRYIGPCEIEPPEEPLEEPPEVSSCDLQGTWEGYWINAKTDSNYVLTIASQEGSNFQGDAYLTSDDPQYYVRYSLRGTVNEDCSEVSFVEYAITEQNSSPSSPWCVPCEYEMELNDTLTVMEGTYNCPNCGGSDITGQVRFER